jgi:hypothetical protein
MEAWPTYQSLEHGARPNQGLRPPGRDIRPRSAQARDFRLGAERAAARGYIVPDDSESEEERAAGGPGLEPPFLSVHSLGWRRYREACNRHGGSPQAES